MRVSTIPNNIYHRASIAVAAVGLAGTWGIMLWAAMATLFENGLTGALVLPLLMAWAGAPYLLLAVPLLRSESNAARSFVLLIGAITITGFGLYAYVWGFFVESDAQSGLLFVFVPMPQGIAVPFIALVASLAGRGRWY